MNGGAWGVRNRGGGAYNQDVQDRLEEIEMDVQAYNLKRFGANTVTKYIDEYVFCDANGDIRFLGFLEALPYYLGFKKAREYKDA